MELYNGINLRTLGFLIVLLAVLLVPPGIKAGEITGMIIAIKDNVITIRLNPTEHIIFPGVGDEAKVSYTVGEDVFHIGSWWVSAVKDGGIVEAEPVEIIGEPTLGMDVEFGPKEKHNARKPR
jgi:hypothetical protein